MKKLIALLLTLVMSLSLCACVAKDPPKEPVDITNPPVSENETQTPGGEEDVATPDEITNPGLAGLTLPAQAATYDELLAMGFDVQAPVGAEEVRYTFFNTDPVMVEMYFKFEGIDYYYRMSPTSDFQDISGMFYPAWNVSDNTAKVGHVENAVVSITDDAEMLAGRIAWYDVVPGMMYSLAAPYAANEESLIAVANNIFIPLQTEADPDRPETGNPAQVVVPSTDEPVQGADTAETVMPPLEAPAERPET